MVYVQGVTLNGNGKIVSFGLSMKHIKAGLLSTFILMAGLMLATSTCSAQYEVSSGFDVSYPFLVNASNSSLNYSQLSFGVKVGLAYKPPETQFFPILNVSFGRTKLPLLQMGQNVAVLNFNYLNVMLNENFIVRFPKSEVFIYGGIGFSDLIRKRLQITGSGGEQMKANIDSTANITSLLPALNIGAEYNYGESTGKDLYLTMGVNLQYIMLLNDRNTYYLSVDKSLYTHANYTVNLTGNLVTPSFYIALHYLLHKHSKSKMYL